MHFASRRFSILSPDPDHTPPPAPDKPPLEAITASASADLEAELMDQDPIGPAEGTLETLAHNGRLARRCPRCSHRWSPSLRNTEQRRRKNLRPGRPGLDDIERRFREALDNLGDPLLLAGSPLTKLPIITYVADRIRERRGVIPEGNGLKKVLIRALSDIERDLPGSHVAALAKALREGRSQASLSRETGRSEEAISRVDKPRLVTIVRLHVEELSRRVPGQSQAPTNEDDTNAQS